MPDKPPIGLLLGYKRIPPDYFRGLAIGRELLPGALGPNQRGPGWGSQPGSGLAKPKNHSAEHRENKARPLFSLYADPRPGLALAVVGAIQRGKHRLRRMHERGTIAELLVGLALVTCAVLLLAPVIQ
jgi:hypothetical protein